jgi:hypothetical protein
VGVLKTLRGAASSGSEVLAEGVPRALQNLLLMLHDWVSGREEEGGSCSRERIASHMPAAGHSS